MAVENIAKKVIIKGTHDIFPNYVAGGMDATEGTYVWDHIMRSCPEEEWGELYKGRLGVLEDESASAGRGQEACYAYRGERTGEHKTGMELSEGP